MITQALQKERTFSELSQTATNLLISSDCPVDQVAEKVGNASFTAMSPSGFVGCRCSGTTVRKTNTGHKIVGWQKNITRLRKMDVALPTIITLELDRNETITDVVLDPSFRGSQGVMCSHTYLDKHLRKSLIGLKFAPENAERFLVKQMHCYHLMEVLLAALSFFQHIDKNGVDETSEVETDETYLQNGLLISAGYHEYRDGYTENYTLTLHDIDSSGVIVFNEEARLSCLNKITATFDISGERVVRMILDGTTPNECVHALMDYFHQSCGELAKNLFFDEKAVYAHSGIYPYSVIGVFIQALAISLFPGNYQYVNQVVRALSRNNGKPYCVGTIDSVDEAQRFFPGFSL